MSLPFTPDSQFLCASPPSQALSRLSWGMFCIRTWNSASITWLSCWFWWHVLCQVWNSCTLCRWLTDGDGCRSVFAERLFSQMGICQGSWLSVGPWAGKIRRFQVKSFGFGGTLPVQSVEHVALDLGIVSSSPMLDVEITKINNLKKKQTSDS